MKKFMSLLKASTKGGLNLFKIKGIGNFNYLIFLGLVIIFLISSYTYAGVLAEPLYEAGLTYITITLFSFVIVIITIVEGIYKAQGVIFDAKDNNMLFSMPINKSYILISRFLKILLFNYFLEFILLVPCLFKYVTLISPSISFYLISILFFILLPLIPLVLSCVIGYIIKAISIRFRNKKLVQTIVTLIFFLTIIIISFQMESLVKDIISKAMSLNDLISKIYLPIGLYINLINKFDFINLINLVLISVIPFVLFIILFSSNYDKIINYSKENSSRKKAKIIKEKSIIRSLTIKEIKTYFGIPIYIINTIITPIMILLLSVLLLVKFDYALGVITSAVPGLDIDAIYRLSSCLYIAIILIFLSLSTITASSISLEGGKYSFLKSMPVREKDIFLSKLLLNDIIMIPPFLIGAIVYIIKFQVFNYNIIFILLASFLLPHINGMICLIINLMFPKLNYNSEVEVVKQSIAVLASMIVNFMFAVVIIYSFCKLLVIFDETVLLIIYMFIFILILLILYRVLSTYGKKKFREIS